MSDVNKIEIRQRAGTEGKLMCGANTEVLLNGEKVKMCKSIKFEVDARGLAVVTMEMIGTVAIVGEIGSLTKKFLNLVPEKIEELEGQDGSAE